MLFLVVSLDLCSQTDQVSTKDIMIKQSEKDILYLGKNPGGTAIQPVLWLKSNAGTNTATDGDNVNSWLDQSTNLYDAHSDINSTDDPVFRTNGINFNPGIEFDGDFTDFYSDGLHLGSDYITSSNLGIHVFIICDPDVDVGTDNHVFDFGLAANGGFGMMYSNDDIGIYSNTSYGGASTEILHSYGDEPALVEGRILFNEGNFFFRNGIQEIGVPITLSELSLAEINEASAYGNILSSSGPVSIGRKSASVYLDNNGSRIFDGKISEVIVYDDALLPAEIEGVESYLAMKYGITLNHNYYLSNGTQIKNIANGFDHDIAGIGRDDGAELLQKQSKSVSQDAIFTIGRGEVATTNAANSFTFVNDNVALMWSNDNTPINVNWNTNNISIPTVGYARIDRLWRLEKTGVTGQCRFRIDVDNPSFNLPPMDPNADGRYYLIFDDDGDYTNGGQAIFPFTNIGAGDWETIVNNPNYNYFTIAIKMNEICNNGIDDDGDSFIDCLDIDCYLAQNCTDSDADGVNDILDLDDDNDGVLDLIECPLTDSGIDGSLSAVDVGYSITGDFNNALEVHTLDSISTFGDTYIDFVKPDWYRSSFVGIGNLNKIYSIENGLKLMNYVTSSNWNADILPSFQSPNLNYYQGCDAANLDGSHHYVLGYNQPILINDKNYLVYSERGGNNTVTIKAFGPSGNWLGSTVVINPSDYIATACKVAINLTASQPVELAFFSLDDFGPVGSYIASFKVYFRAAVNDGADGKVYVFGNYDQGLCDQDGDGVMNHLDIDADNDGIYDVVEMGNGAHDTDNDGEINGGVGLNGIANIMETFNDSGVVNYLLKDTDADGLYDIYQLDSDGDGCNDVNEAGFSDSDMDGVLGVTPIITDVKGKVIITP